mgnify:CR=1 FL=1
MKSYDNEFTLYFKTREKSVLAKGQEFNYIKDYPQDLYYLQMETSFLNKSLQIRYLFQNPV